MRRDMKILVTGAGGFIGGWVVEAFHLAGFHGVRAGVRKWSSAARVGRFPVEVVLCDVMNPKQVEDAVKGADAVIHCAVGTVETNAEGTRNVLEASLMHGIQRVVHLSTISVYGNVAGEVDESHPLQRTGSDYGDSKIEAEEFCREYQKRGLPIVVLRPTIVYGPYSKLWIVKFSERLSSGNWGLMDGIGEGTCNLVYVSDLVRAIALSLESSRAVGEAININSSERLTWNDYFRGLNNALGLPELQHVGRGSATFRSLARMPLRYAARYARTHYPDLITAAYQRSAFARKLMKRTEKSLTTTPSTDELKQFQTRAYYNNTKARTLLGFEPCVDMQIGLRLSAGWFKHEYAGL